VLHLSVKQSLDHTLCQKVGSEDCHLLAAIVARLLAWSMDVNSALRPGDQMHLVYETLSTKSKFRILKLEYASQYLKRKLDINYYRTPSMSYGSYFDDEGLELTSHLGSSTTPIRDYSEITSLPGEFRQGREHAGTDFKAEVGTPVFSSFSGRVTRINWNRGKNGFCVEIDHPQKGVKTVYLHLNRVRVSRGQNVRQGQHIGDSGNTGRSFAPHLHYEVRGRGAKKEIYNPFSFKYHRKYQRKISRKNLADYLKTVRRYDSFLREG
jgi:murein DD-endopeptidase MepM/ murein hydrolase activator NlpD